MKRMRGILFLIIAIIVISVTISSGCIIGEVSDEREATSPTYTYSGQTTPSSSCILGSYPVTIDDPLGMGTQNIRTYSMTAGSMTVIYSDGTIYANAGSSVTIKNGPDVYAKAGNSVSITGNGAKYAKYA